MNRLTSKQRKIIYWVALGILLTGSAVMGMPGQGILARERLANDLGEATLGEVDPASSTLNLVLLGMRGIAANLLWMEADYLKETKNWSELEQRVNSIILLQPHFKQVWQYQSWNLAYNVSAECDRVDDRYYWVKRGIKFIMQGTRRNAQVPELFHDTGFYIGNKIGTSDEKLQFRRYFLDDPMDVLYQNGPDPEINPERNDNYLVAREWYFDANELVEGGKEQHKMAAELFLAYPYRSQIAYASALQSMGDPLTGQPEWEEAREAWARAYDEWTGDFGRTLIPIPIPPLVIQIRLEPDDDDAYNEMLAEQNEFFKENVPAEDQLQWILDAQRVASSTSSYRYWRLRCDTEQNEEMMAARRNYFEGKRLFYEPPQDFAAAQASLYSSMEAYQEIVTRFPDLIETTDTDVLEDALKAVIVWQDIIINKHGETLPEDYPLKSLWEDPRYSYAKEEYMTQFLAWQGGNL